jgi:DNA repair exonuclease SbcCD ATPase subunit
MDPSLDSLPDDPATLKAMIIAQRAEADRMAASVRAYEALVQALRIRIARLKRQKFGASSEKIEREIDQLQLALEDLEVAIAAAAEPAEPEPPAATTQRAAPRRRGKPRITGPLARERIILDPGERCPDCGGVLRLVGEDLSEILDLIAARLKVIETARLKKSCRHCEKIVQPAAPTRPLPRARAGPGLLAHILVYNPQPSNVVMTICAL